MNYTHVAISSKLLQIEPFETEEEAQEQADEWEALAPVGAHDAESPAYVITWDAYMEFVEMIDTARAKK